MAVVVGHPLHVTVTPEIGLVVVASVTVPLIPPSSVSAAFSVVLAGPVTVTGVIV